MARKLIDFYTPVKTRQLLRDRFGRTPDVMILTDKMSRTVKCVFAALCDGMTVTTAGYNIPADFFVNRASAIVHRLRELNIPVESKFAPAISDTGGVTRQSIFYIERSTVLRLISEPKKVIDAYARERDEKKWLLVRTDLKRMLDEYGKHALISVIEKLVQEEALTEQKEKIKKKIIK